MSEESINLLLLEDNPAEARIIQEYMNSLKHSNYNLKIVDSLSQALTQVASGNVDLVITDLTVPDSFGVDTFISLKQKSKTVPVIVMTNMEDESISKSLIGAGAKDYIYKSKCDPKTFETAVKKALKRADTAEKIRLKQDIESDLKKFPEAKNDLLEIYEKVLLQSKSEEELKNRLRKEFQPQTDGIILLGVNDQDFKQIHEEVTKRNPALKESLKNIMLSSVLNFIHEIYS